MTLLFARIRDKYQVINADATFLQLSEKNKEDMKVKSVDDFIKWYIDFVKYVNKPKYTSIEMIGSGLISYWDYDEMKWKNYLYDN